MSRARFLNSCWMASCYGESRRFAADANNLQSAQQRVLLDTVRLNHDCWFGREHGFSRIQSIDDFRKQVPVVEYDDIRLDIERICDGEQNVLTTEPVLLLEPTSGTSSKEKLIPFTASLQREFQRAVRTWIYDLFHHRPATRKGRAYWSISPLAQDHRVTAGGLPVGFADDTAYLGRWERGIVSRTLAVPPDVALISDVRASRYVTLFFLMQADDLSLVSVWSPTFLIELLRQMRGDWHRLCDDIERGILDSGALSKHPFAGKRFATNRRRAEFLRTVFTGNNTEADQVSMIWPRLALVSSWADGASATYVDCLKERLGQIELQPKGLLATEAFVSVPVVHAKAPALAYRSHFFEFLPASERGSASGVTLLAHELEVGNQYEVIVTNGGGLYRYRLFDQVEVVGHKEQIPLLRFLGRANATSDLVGEKLTEAQAACAVRSALDESNIRPSFVSLVPEMGPPPRYSLRIAAPGLNCESDIVAAIAGRLDERLGQYASYRYARDLGQLEAVNVQVASASEIDGWADYESACIARGQRLGNVKAPVFNSMYERSP